MLFFFVVQVASTRLLCCVGHVACDAGVQQSVVTHPGGRPGEGLREIRTIQVEYPLSS